MENHYTLMYFLLLLTGGTGAFLISEITFDIISDIKRIKKKAIHFSNKSVKSV